MGLLLPELVPGLQFPRERVQTIWRHGSVPYIAFLPTSATSTGRDGGGATRRGGTRCSGSSTASSTASCVPGQTARAGRTCRSLLSFGAEINDDWGPWNGKWNGAGENDGYGDPTYPDGAERYRDAYRHLVDVFREEGATTSPSFSTSIPTRRSTAGTSCDWYYPGDVYVDWIGISVYGRL